MRGPGLKQVTYSSVAKPYAIDYKERKDLYDSMASAGRHKNHSRSPLLKNRTQRVLDDPDRTFTRNTGYQRSNNNRKAFALLFGVATIASAVGIIAITSVATGGLAPAIGIAVAGAIGLAGYSFVKLRWNDWGKNGWNWKIDFPALIALGVAPLIAHFVVAPVGASWLAALFSKTYTPLVASSIITSGSVIGGIGSIELFSADQRATNRRIRRENKDLKDERDKGGSTDIDPSLSLAKQNKELEKKFEELLKKEKQSMTQDVSVQTVPDLPTKTAGASNSRKSPVVVKVTTDDKESKRTERNRADKVQVKKKRLTKTSKEQKKT